MAAKEVKREAFEQSKSVGVFIEQVALKCEHQSQSMTPSAPELPNRDENDSTERGRRVREHRGHWKKCSEASILAQNGT